LTDSGNLLFSTDYGKAEVGGDCIQENYQGSLPCFTKRSFLYVRAESIVVEPSVSQVGEAAVGEQRTFTIQLSNHRDRPVKIMGGTTTCSCITTDDLPIIVPPNESRGILVRMRFQGRPGRFQHSVVLYTDNENQQTVTARFAGRVFEQSSQ